MEKQDDMGLAAARNLLEEVNSICRESDPFRHIQALDYPRMAGTPGCDAAATYLTHAFSEYGYAPQVEELVLPQSAQIGKLLLPILFIIWGIFSYYNAIFIVGGAGFLYAILVLYLPFFLLVLILKMEILFRRMIKNNYKRIIKLQDRIKKGKYTKEVKRGRNLYVEYIPETYDEHLYLTAHYDSTTLRFSMRGIKLLMGIGLLSGIIYIVGYIANYLFLIFMGINLIQAYSFLFLLILLIFLVSIGLVLVTRALRTNESHGAIDDLTGTAVLLELANLVRVIKPQMKITFILFTAEEIGFFGSSYHYHLHEDSFEKNQLHVVSIDMIGEIPPLTLIKKIKPVLGLAMDPEFNAHMVKLAEQLGIALHVGTMPYPASDFACWFLNGYRANYMENPSKLIHSRQDIAANVNRSLLIECLKLFTAYLITKRK